MKPEDRIKELEKRLAELEPTPTLLKVNGKEQKIVAKQTIKIMNKSGKLWQNSQTKSTYCVHVPVFTVEEK